jgi:dynein intermediate chain 1
MENGSKGVACVFSLKNPAHPEFICLSSCAIMCIDMNPCHPHMMVVGLMDGNVAVYNLQNKTQHPVYTSDARNGKHKKLVNQVSNNICSNYQTH